MKLHDFLHGIRWFQFSPDLARTFGRTESILVCWVIFRTRDDGTEWVTATYRRIHDEAALSAHEVRTSLARLRGIVTVARIPGGAYRLKVDPDALERGWEKGAAKRAVVIKKSITSSKLRGPEVLHGLKDPPSRFEGPPLHGLKDSVHTEERPKNDKKKKRASARARGNPPDPHPSGPAPIPDRLADATFVEAWHDWLAVRVETKHPMKPTQQRLVLARLERMASHPRGGLEATTRLVRRSAEHGWRGIFPEDDQKSTWAETESGRWKALAFGQPGEHVPGPLESLPAIEVPGATTTKP